MCPQLGNGKEDTFFSRCGMLNGPIMCEMKGTAFKE